MPAFFSNFYLTVASAGGDVLQAVLQNPGPREVKVILLDFDFNANIPTFEARRFAAAASLVPVEARPSIGCLDNVAATPNAIIATIQSDTITPAGSPDLIARVFDVTTQRSLFTPLAILVPVSACVAIYTVDQVGSRSVLFRLAWTETT